MSCNPLLQCQCKRSEHPPKLVVLTGGPGAGKTALLEMARRSFCEHIAILPEAASIIFGGGFWRRDTVAATKAAQRAIFQVQRELERVVVEEGKSAIGLCDRGTLDGLAYWPGDPKEFFSELGIAREKELARYAAVIHLRTPALDQGYNHSNPVRIESAAQAAEIDRRIIQAWDGHPRRFFVESSSSFIEKVARAVELIRVELPECCRGHEIDELKGGKP